MSFENLVNLLGCPDDGAALRLGSNLGARPCALCTSCRTELRLDGGILRLLDASALDEEAAHELGHREQMAADVDYAEGFRSTWRLKEIDDAEIRPTMNTLGPLAGKTVLELGCGTGRYTTAIAPHCARLVAVDFSLASLRHVARKLDGATNVLPVQADVTKLQVVPGVFDLVTSTLASNLPTAEHRAAMYELAGKVLRPGGRFVFSVHHQSLRERMKGTPPDGRYTEGGIYRRHFTADEIRAELAPYFRKVKARPIQVTLPGAWHLRLPLAAMSRLLEPIPVLNELGLLLLVEASA